MEMRYDMRMDGRRLPPRNSRGEFRRRRSRRDRGMDYGYDMRGDMRNRDYGNYDMDMDRGGNRGGRGRGRSDYGDYNMNDGRDYRGGMDGHHYPQGQGSTYYPIQAMGTFEGYYGMPEQDYGRGGDMNYRSYDMRGRDYGYPMYDMRGGRDYGYDDYGDYGETLSEKELEHWCEKLKKKLDEQEKQMFNKDILAQKTKQMNLQMKGFGEKELEVATLMAYTDYKKTIGKNPDMAIRLAYDWLTDDDVAVKGAEKLAVYYDEIVMGGEDD